LYPNIDAVKPGFATVAAVLVIALLPAAGHAADGCVVPGGRTIASGRVAKLISVPTPGGFALFACIRRSGRKIALDEGVSDARLAGRWVAWQRARTDRGWRIAVHDLRTGRERLVVGHVAEQSLQLTTRGSVAWAQELDASPATPLYANEPGSGGRLLDDGAVDAKSVALAGRRVTWLSGGERRTALVR
jgi:hypothetical protein